MERLPLFERKFARNLALSRLESINEAIKIHIESEKEPGFLTGMAGEALFLYEYGRFSGDSRAENLGFLALERTLTFISNGFSWPSFAAGLAGIRFALGYLATRNHISPADGAALDEINPLLSHFAADRFAAGDYDFLHGALGMYLAPHLLSPTQITDPLHNSAIAPAPGHLAWQSKHPQTGTPEINLGLAHGIPSVLLALSQLPDDPQAAQMLKQGVDFLLTCRQPAYPNGSLFPHRLVEGMPDQAGRLAWCYGDAGIGYALWQIGVNSNRPDWQADAIGILHKAASRRDTDSNRVNDACICHGSAGLALMFYKMALVSGHEELLDAANHWIRITLDQGGQVSASAGYLFATTGDRYRTSYSLLEGIAGVGLTLLGLLDAETLGWEGGILL